MTGNKSTALIARVEQWDGALLKEAIIEALHNNLDGLTESEARIVRRFIGDCCVYAASCGAREHAAREVMQALHRSLSQAVRYVEVCEAYKGAMTAEKVEQAVLARRNVSLLAIGANSANTLARFDIQAARDVLAKACTSELVSPSLPGK